MINLKKREEIMVLREGGSRLADILQHLKRAAVPGATTGDLEDLACKLIDQVGGRPALKGYKPDFGDEPFATALCTSINNEVVHAPSLPARKLKNGDILSIDFSMEYPIIAAKQTMAINKHSRLGGFFTDMAETIAIGEVDAKTELLLQTTKEALALAIEQVRPGNSLNDVARAIQTHAEAAGFSVVRDLVGHGVGYAVHEEPQVLNYVVKDNVLDKIILKPGMVIAIEPMINMGGCDVKTEEDGWTISTLDGELSAHFEHTVAVTDKGHIVITSK